jgi:hypothetical protein
MNYENKNYPSLRDLNHINKNDSNFVDKLISTKGILKMILFFSFQISILIAQLGSVFKDLNLEGAPLTDVNYWDYHLSFLITILMNYAVFLSILLLVSAFYLGKEINTRRKEKIVLFSFKAFLFFIVWLLLNGIILFQGFLYYYYAKSGIEFQIYVNQIFINPLISFLIGIWILILFLLLVNKIISSVLKIGKKNNISEFKELRNDNFEQEKLVNVINANNGINKEKELIKNEKNSPVMSIKEERLDPGLKNLSQEEIVGNKQIFKADVEHTNIKTKENNQNEKQNESKTAKAKVPVSIIEFLEKNFFKRTFNEQIIIFFIFSQLFWFSLFTLDIYSKVSSNPKFFKDYYYSSTSMITAYGLVEMIYYAIIIYFYYDTLIHHFTLPQIDARNKSLILVGIGSILIFTSIYIGNSFYGTDIVYFVVLKYLFLLAIPAFYFGYKNQNISIITSPTSKIAKINPVYSYIYNKSLSELRVNEKSYEITKKFLLVHKNDIKLSLVNATPINFKENIKTVIAKDYERLKTLLAYNNIQTQSKIAIIDFTMEVFSTFLINLEVNLQDIYTEHLLKSNADNMLKPISSDFIESKFSKLFSQWESLEITS